MFGHPRGLTTLFFTEMWERFSYYGMRALLVLYLTSELVKGGFSFSREHALEIYGIFTSLVYLTPLLGGLIADKILGQRKAIYIGGFLMAFGQLSLAVSQFGAVETRSFWLMWGLGLLVAGNGFFKPNISAMVGSLYAENDPREDSAFTFFYMGINVGAFFSPIIAGTLGETYGWGWGFFSAAVGMFTGITWFYFQSHHIGSAGLPPKRVYNAAKRWQLNLRDRIEIVVYIVATAVLVLGLLTLWTHIGESIKTNLLWGLAIVGTIALISLIAKNTKGKSEWSKVFVIVVLCIFSIFFFAGFEQAGGTMNLFAEHNTNRVTFLGTIPASMFQSVNPVFIIIFSFVFTILWSWLSARKKEPNIPVKFGLGMLFLGLGFWVMSIADSHSANGYLVSPLWLVMVYLLHTFGELCLSPIGLSMISRLAPPRIVSVMMGLWFACSAMAQYLAGALESILHNYLPSMPLFSFITMTSMITAGVILLMSPMLNKLMKSA